MKYLQAYGTYNMRGGTYFSLRKQTAKTFETAETTYKRKSRKHNVYNECLRKKKFIEILKRRQNKKERGYSFVISS